MQPRYIQDSVLIFNYNYGAIMQIIRMNDKLLDTFGRDMYKS